MFMFLSFSALLFSFLVLHVQDAFFFFFFKSDALWKSRKLFSSTKATVPDWHRLKMGHICVKYTLDFAH